MLSKVVFALLLAVTLGFPTERAENTRPSLQDADWKQRLTGLNRQTQNADGGDEEVQAQPLTDPEAVDHSAVKATPEKQAVNWWEKDHSEVVAAAEPAVAAAEEPAVLNAEEPIADAAAPAVEGEPQAVAASAAPDEEEVAAVPQKESHTNVEGTWNKEPARQEKEPIETKPWWETDSTTANGDSSSSAAPFIPEEKGEEEPAVTEFTGVLPEEEVVAAVPHSSNNSQKVKPLTPHHSSSSVNTSVNNDD